MHEWLKLPLLLSGELTGVKWVEASWWRSIGAQSLQQGWLAVRRLQAHDGTLTAASELHRFLGGVLLTGGRSEVERLTDEILGSGDVWISELLLSRKWRHLYDSDPPTCHVTDVISVWCHQQQFSKTLTFLPLSHAACGATKIPH